MTSEYKTFDYKTIQYQVDNKILTLLLNRPEVMNAYTIEMCNELVHAFNRASDDDDVSVIVVTGAGKAFCAGMDLSAEGNVFGLDESRTPTFQEMQAYEEMDGVRDSAGKVTLAIYDCKKPVIGAINGAAVGVGATMACAMDIRLASEKARFGFVFGKIGIVAEGCSTWFLPRIVGMQQSMKWMLSGEIFNAAEGLAGGLVYEVCAPDMLLARAYEMARQIADNYCASGRGTDASDALSQLCGGPSGRSSQGGISGGVLHQPGRWQRGCRVIFRKASGQLLRQSLYRYAVVLPLVVSVPIYHSPLLMEHQNVPKQ